MNGQCNKISDLFNKLIILAMINYFLKFIFYSFLTIVHLIVGIVRIVHGQLRPLATKKK